MNPYKLYRAEIDYIFKYLTSIEDDFTSLENLAQLDLIIETAKSAKRNLVSLGVDRYSVQNLLAKQPDEYKAFDWLSTAHRGKYPAQMNFNDLNDLIKREK